MSIETTIQALIQKSTTLSASLPLTWRYPKRPTADPLHATLRPDWKVLERPDQEEWKKGEDNWFYADVSFPATRAGLSLAGRDILCFVDGWMPFGLWINGTQVWQEEHAWKATGPIADPFPFPIDPAQRHRLVLSVRPTEIPATGISLLVRLVPRDCLELSIDLQAAAAQLSLAAELAQTDRERTLVDRGAGCIDRKALAANRWSAVHPSIEKMEQTLLPLSPRAKAIVVHTLGHAHIDMDWQWTWPDTVHCIRRDMKAAADLMDDYADLTFTHSQVPTYQVVRSKDPRVFKKIVARIREGRWENAAGTWVEGDLNMADGEAIARHMLYAADWTQTHLHSKARVLWEPDTFGHPGNMPQLARLGEFDSYFHMRCHPDKNNALKSVDRDADPPSTIRIWTGIDGTDIPAFCLGYNGHLLPDMLAAQAVHATQQGLHNAFYIWGIGDHGGGLSRLQLGLLERYRHRPLIPTVHFSTLRDLLAAVQRENVRLPQNRGETYSLFEGCFTTHATIKAYNRLCEGRLLAAETLAALAGLDRNAQLRDGWTAALFNHFHDIMDGAAVHDAYVDAHKRAEKSLRAARRAIAEAAAELVPTGRLTGEPPSISPASVSRPRVTTAHGSDPTHLTLINPLGFERTEPVRVKLPKDATGLEDARGKPIPVQRLADDFMFIAKALSAFGSASYRVLRGGADAQPVTRVQVAEDQRFNFFNIETTTALIRINRGSGAIGSYFDKRLQREFVAYGYPIPLSHTSITHAELALNVFQVIDESPNPMSAWLINDIARHENLLNRADVTLVQTGPVFAHFRVRHAFRSSRVEQDVLVFRDCPRVAFDTRIDWREKGSDLGGIPQLKVSFAANMAAARCRTEGPFVVREIPANGMEMPTQKWADLSGDGLGFTLLNDSKYAIDALGSRLRITLLRNACRPDPETDNGQHLVRFAFEPHDGRRSNADLVRSGMAYNRPPIAVLSETPAQTQGSRLTIKGTRGVVCTALRRAEHSKALLLRFFETSGRGCSATVCFGDGMKTAREVNFLENPIGKPLRPVKGAVRLRFRPFEVKSVLFTSSSP